MLSSRCEISSLVIILLIYDVICLEKQKTSLCYIYIYACSVPDDNCTLSSWLTFYSKVSFYFEAEIESAILAFSSSILIFFLIERRNFPQLTAGEGYILYHFGYHSGIHFPYLYSG